MHRDYWAFDSILFNDFVHLNLLIIACILFDICISYIFVEWGKNMLMWLWINFSANSVLCCDFIIDCFRAASVRILGLSECVVSSVWMSGCSDSELKNFTLLMVHTPETVTSLTPWGTLTKIHLLCSTRWGKSFFCVCCWWRQIIPVRPRGCQGSSAQSHMTVLNRTSQASEKWVLSRWQN